MLSPRTIFNVFYAIHNYSQEEMRIKSRKAELVEARCLCANLLLQNIVHPDNENRRIIQENVAEEIGVDRCTIIHYVKIHEKKIKHDWGFASYKKKWGEINDIIGLVKDSNKSVDVLREELSLLLLKSSRIAAEIAVVKDTLTKKLESGKTSK